LLQDSVAVVDRCVLETPSYAKTVEPLACGATGNTLLSVNPTALPQRFELVNAVCVADQGTDRFFPVGDEVENSEFVSLTTAIEDGADRLRRILVVDGGGFQSFTGQWSDTMLGGTCRFGAAVDGSFRCLPEPLSSVVLFSDALCTVPVRLARVDGCEQGHEFFTLPAPLGTRVLASAPHVDPVFARQGLNCVPEAGSFLVPEFELAPSSFVEATLLSL